MRKRGAVILMAAGLAAAVAGYHQYSSKYDPSSVFKRQKLLVDVKSGSEKAKKANFEKLKTGLREADSAQKRCEFEITFSERLRHGSEEKAEEAIANRSYEPFEECTTSSRVEASVTEQWYGWAGVAAIVFGIAGLFRRKED